MATFIDEGDQPQEDEEYSSFEEEEQQEEEPEEETPEPEEEEDDLPEKYKGKSVKDIVRMHQEAEKAMGKQGSEVGELRRIVDDFVKAQTVTKQAPDVEEEIDYFSDPDKAIARAIDNHPKIKQAEQYTAEMARTKALAELKEAHPDFQQVVQDPEFSEWITKSNVRKELFSRADQRYDFDAAHELLSTWKERKQVVSNTVKAEKNTRSQAIKAASTGSSKGSGESSKKVYRRADIIELMQKNPDRYAALSDDIMKAYAEGRVR